MDLCHQTDTPGKEGQAYLGQSGDVEFVQLAHVVSNSAEISCHVQGNNKAVKCNLHHG